jgi:aldose 1-epimerase
LGRPLRVFGTTRAGADVHAITLTRDGLGATILTYGAVLQNVRLDGVAHGLTLGSECLRDYEGNMGFHGSIVGPVANRLTDATAPIAGTSHRFDSNFMNRHTLHSGSAGIHDKVWHIDECTDYSLILSHELPDAQGGFPGNRRMTALFEILSDQRLRLTLTTTTDAPSLVNATNHSYWNLDGSDHMHDHSLRVDADRYLATDHSDIPTGDIRLVAGTPYDFQRAKPIGPNAPPLDHTFCVADGRRDLCDCMVLTGASGLSMRVATTEPGVHLYDARAAQRPGKPKFEGLAIECQGWPDAPNKAGFPSIEITPDTPVVQITQWQFVRT